MIGRHYSAPVRYVCKTCGAESPTGIGYACQTAGPLPAPADACPNRHESAAPLKFGTRVAFGAVRGDVPITLGGTVMPSRFVRWALVRTDSGELLELRRESLTIMHTLSEGNRS